MNKINYLLIVVLLYIISAGCEKESPEKNLADKVYATDSLNLPDYFYKKLEGTIGDDLKINMTMFREDTMLYGNYFYKKIGKPIEFSYSSRIYDTGKFIIEEFGGYDENYQIKSTGKFEGAFKTNQKAGGKWINPETGKKLNFNLTEYYPEGSVQLEITNHSKNYKNANIEITVPHIKNFRDKKVSMLINDFIQNKLQQKTYIEDSVKSFSSYEEAMNSFIERYKEFVLEDYDTVEYDYPHFENDFAIQVKYNENYILSLEDISYVYEGGAHGIGNYLYYNFDLHDGAQITLEDIFKGNFWEVLTKAGEEKLREQYNIAKDESINEAGFWFENDQFQLNENYSLNGGGITFGFNPYEIAPYAVGAPEIFIPYSEIKEIIKEDGLLGFAL